MKKPLRYFRYMDREIVAKLNDGLKTVMKVTTPRTVSWWLVLPAQGDKDCVCVMIRKAPKWELTAKIEKQILDEYADRITQPNHRPVFPSAKPGDAGYTGQSAEELAAIAAAERKAVEYWSKNEQ